MQVDAAVMQAIYISDNYWRAQRSKSLLDACCTSQPRAIKKRAFVATLVPKDYPSQITLGEGREYHEHAGLRDHVSSLIKYAENAIRERAAYKRRLDDIRLPDDLESQLREALWPQTTPVLANPTRSVATAPDAKSTLQPNAQTKPTNKISINLGRVASLQTESQEIESLLSESNLAISEAAGMWQSATKALLTDLASVRKLWRDFSEPHKHLIAYLTANQPCNEEVLKSLLPADQLVHVAIDAINEQALNHLGEVIIHTQDMQILLEEDFVDELQVVLHESPPLPKSTATQQEAGSLNNPWQEFVKSLTSAEIDLARELARNASVTNQNIDELARPHHMMGSMLLDQFAEKAIAILAHSIVYSDGDRWCIEEDDLPTLRQVIH